MDTLFIILTILGVILFFLLSYLKVIFLNKIQKDRNANKEFYIWFPFAYLYYLYKHKA